MSAEKRMPICDASGSESDEPDIQRLRWKYDEVLEDKGKQEYWLTSAEAELYDACLDFLPWFFKREARLAPSAAEPVLSDPRVEVAARTYATELGFNWYLDEELERGGNINRSAVRALFEKVLAAVDAFDQAGEPTDA